MNAEKLAELITRFPTPASKDGKLAEVDKQATDAVLAELVKGGRAAVVGLVDLLAADGKGDSQARHALHALVLHAGGPKNAAVRAVVSEALASTLGTDRSKEVQGFIVRQLQLVGGKEAVPSVGKLLSDETLGEEAARALLAIKEGAAEQLRAALPKAAGRSRLAIVQALGECRDIGAAPQLSKLLADKDRDTRITAAWALANAGDPGSAEALLKLADSTEGYERIKATQACLLLAERLVGTGSKKEAARIYTHLNDSRTEPAERHIREAAARGLAAVK